MLIINIILSVIFAYFAFYIFYFFFLAIAGNLRGSKKYDKSDKLGKFLILIPAYKEDGIIVSTTQEALNHDYPADNFEVAVIADKLQPATLEKLRSMPVRVIEVFFEKSTKAKSLNYALANVPDDYDYVLILDADNVMGKGCLHILNTALQSGYLAVQGHRTAKNKNTNFAVLDGMAEEINNHIFRIGHRAIGLSAALIGSAMAFDFQYYKKIMDGLEEMGSEDQETELRIMKTRNKIEYVADAHIYDEKVQSAEVFAKQRTRWIAGQFAFLGKYGGEGLQQLFKGNIDYVNKMLQKLIPPRVIMLGLIPLMGVALFIVSIFFHIDFATTWWLWIGLLGIYALTMFISIPKSLYTAELFKALLSLPRAVFMMAIGIFGIGKAHKTNFHTPKTTTTVEETK
jgi:cellulose synthase/poly-beta-1,6-N-acetylglucosamine synthase-like glycosyltransferase